MFTMHSLCLGFGVPMGPFKLQPFEMKARTLPVRQPFFSQARFNVLSPQSVMQ